MLRTSATPSASLPSIRIATSGSAMRVMKLPNVETVVAVTMRWKAGLLHSPDALAAVSVTARTLASVYTPQPCSTNYPTDCAMPSAS